MMDKNAFKNAVKCWNAAGQIERYRFKLISERVTDRIWWLMIGAAVGFIGGIILMVLLAGKV